jgi:hypothetical protein
MVPSKPQMPICAKATLGPKPNRHPPIQRGVRHRHAADPGL